jgi:HrpA-like RNA helicase
VFQVLLFVLYFTGRLRGCFERGRLAESRLVAHKKAIARSKQIREEMNRRSTRAPTLAESQQILAQFRQQQQTAAYKKWQQVRAKLPAAKKRAELLELMASSQALVVSGETGCGKTTQVPQFLLDDMIESERGASCYIICTQPRRISAVSVAERVADERGEKIGQSVGYQIRLESKKSSSTRLLFCTTGILLRRLQGDSKLEGVSHIVVDEIHERSIDSDFLLIILKELMARRPDIKIVCYIHNLPLCVPLCVPLTLISS